MAAASSGALFALVRWSYEIHIIEPNTESSIAQ